MTITRRSLMKALAAMPACGAAGMRIAHAAAEAPWPARTTRLVVPYSVGGAPDILARLFEQPLGKALGTAVVTDNHGGAGGNLGADFVAKSAPDGATLLLTTAATQVINPALYSKLPYDPVRDFTPVSLVATTPLMLVVSSQSTLRTLADVLAFARAKPGELTYASAGNGTMQHIAGALMESMAHVQATHVPYKGSGQVLPDLVAGRVTIMFNSVAALAPMVQEGKLRAIAVTTPQRLPAWPGVPTMAEAGLPGFEASAWYAVFGPAGLAPALTNRLNAELARVVALPAVRARYDALGLAPATSTPQELAAIVEADLRKWGEFIRERHIEPDK